MNKLFTPPGYVEYPRDRRFRPLDDIGRLELIAKSFYPFCWLAGLMTLVFVMICIEAKQYPVLRYSVCLALNLCIALSIWVALDRIYRAKGWLGTGPAWFALVNAAAGMLLLTNVQPSGLISFVYINSVLFAFGPVSKIVEKQFESFGLKMPGRMSGKEIDKLILSLRRIERTTSASG